MELLHALTTIFIHAILIASATCGGNMKVLFWILIASAVALFFFDVILWMIHRLDVDIYIPFLSELSLIMCAWTIHLMRLAMQSQTTKEDPSS